MPRPFGGVKPQAGTRRTTPVRTASASTTWRVSPRRRTPAIGSTGAARDRTRGSWHDPAAGAQRLDVFATSWLAAHDCSETTRTLYAGYLDNHILPTLGLLQLRQILPPVVRDWYAAEGKRGTPTARARSYALLHQIMGVAADDGAITANPCRIKNVAKAVRHRTKATPDIVLFRRIVARMPKRYRMLLLLAVGSTARYGELAALRRRDVDARPPPCRSTAVVPRRVQADQARGLGPHRVHPSGSRLTPAGAHEPVRGSGAGHR